MLSRSHGQVSITNSVTFLADDSFAEPAQTLCLIEKIIDDSWIDIFAWIVLIGNAKTE